MTAYQLNRKWKSSALKIQGHLLIANILDYRLSMFIKFLYSFPIGMLSILGEKEKKSGLFITILTMDFNITPTQSEVDGSLPMTDVFLVIHEAHLGHAI